MKTVKEIIGKIRNMSMLSKIVFSLCNIFQYFFLLPGKVCGRLFNYAIHWHFKDIKGRIYHARQLKGLQYVKIDYGTILSRGIVLTAWDKYADTITLLLFRLAVIVELGSIVILLLVIVLQ